MRLAACISTHIPLERRTFELEAFVGKVIDTIDCTGHVVNTNFLTLLVYVVMILILKLFRGDTLPKRIWPLRTR